MLEQLAKLRASVACDASEIIRVSEDAFFGDVGRYHYMAEHGRQVAVLDKTGKLVIVVGPGAQTVAERAEDERKLKRILKTLDSPDVPSEPLRTSWLS